MLLRDIAILWDVMEFQDGRHGHTGGPRAKGIQFRSLIAFYVPSPPPPPEISIREHVDIVVKDAMLVHVYEFRTREKKGSRVANQLIFRQRDTIFDRLPPE